MTPAERPRLDIVIPVYNEGANILRTLQSIARAVTTEKRVLICYDREDDDYNAGIIDALVARADSGCDIVCASRFMAGGSMVGCPWLKAFLVRAGNSTLYYLARLPTRDASNGFRLFSRRTMDQIAVESDRGFCYSIELLVKCHRMGWQVGEVPANWVERTQGSSRFQTLRWLSAYLRWYGYAFATTYLRRPARTVPLKQFLRGLTRT